MRADCSKCKHKCDNNWCAFCIYNAHPTEDFFEEAITCEIQKMNINGDNTTKV